jgi:predicted adenylyl cyclase CyaB
LPPSFRTFLGVTDGWQKATHSIDRIRGVDSLAWFRKENRDWVEAFSQPTIYGPEPDVADDEYFAYEQWVEHFRAPHLKETLQISDVGDAAVYLLNPQVISEDGEWEAWFFANWVPGAHRYRSFQEMMEAEFHRIVGREWVQPVGVQGPLPTEYVGAPGSPKRRIKKRKKPKEEKVLGRPLRSWKVEELLDMLAREDYDIIHGEIAMALGKLGDARAVPPLLAKVKNGNGWAMRALKPLAPDDLREALLEHLRSKDRFGFHEAASILVEYQDARAVDPIVGVLTDTRPQSQGLSQCVGQHLAQLGKDGFDALVKLLDPERTLKKSDRGLRLRINRDVESGAQTAVVTMKGPQQSGQFKSREEIEVEVSSAAPMAQVFENLGYRKTICFEKRRESWKLDHCKIELDEVPHLGFFVEIEGPDDARIETVRRRLGLDHAPPIKTSYVAMLSQWLEERGSLEREIKFPLPA